MRFDLRRNFPLKFFSLVLALLVWILTTGESQRVKDLQVPAQFTRLPDGLELSGDVPDTISIRIQAPEPMLQRITGDHVDARLDLSHLQPGDQYLTLSPDRFRVPGATVLRVEPPVLPVRLVRRMEKTVPVVPRLEGKPPEGYEVVDYRVNPDSVAVVGPEDAVREVRRATTGSIPVEGLTVGREFAVHPVPESPEASRVRLKHPGRSVSVRVEIREKPARRVLKDVPVRIRGDSFSVRLAPRTIDVRLWGPASLVNALDRGNLVAEVDLSDLPPRSRDYRVAPRVSLVGLPADRAEKIRLEPVPGSISVRTGPR